MCLYPFKVRGITVNCGKCLDCRLQYSNTWAYRIIREASQHKENCFITFTYRDDCLPSDNCVSVDEVQRFIKRLRKHVAPAKIRYFACGEYGSPQYTERPHYHIIVFGWKPSDLKFYKISKKSVKMYKSEEVSRLWWYRGFITVEDLNLKSARYCAKYLQKVYNDGRKPPFTLQSRKPAIGTRDITLEMIQTDKIYVDGEAHRLPRALIKASIEQYGILGEFYKEWNRQARASRTHIADIKIAEERERDYVEKRTKKLYEVFGRLPVNKFNKNRKCDFINGVSRETLQNVKEKSGVLADSLINLILKED